MARNISTQARQTLAQKRGTEPILILGIQWEINGSTFLYADKAIEEQPDVRPAIFEMGVIDSTLSISLNESSDEISITLSDIDGHIKEIVNTIDIHKRDIFIWQWFPSLPWEQRFLVFQGKINSPISWNDGDRTLSFSGVSQLEDNQVGFTLEEGTFPEAGLDDLIGKTWPECFGTTIHQRGLAIDKKFSGSLADPVGIPDFTLGPQAGSNLAIAGYLISLQVFWALMGGYLRFIGLEEQGDSLLQKANQFGIQAQEFRRKASDIIATFNAQAATQVEQVRIIDGQYFPRGQLVLDIGGAEFTGSFNGPQDQVGSDIFRITKACHPALDDFCLNCPPVLVQLVSCAGGGGGIGGGDFEGEPGEVLACKELPSAECFSFTQVGNRTGRVYTGKINGDTAGPFFAQAGASVKIVSAEPQRYIISITRGQGGIGGTGVLKVAAFTTLESGQRILLDVPQNLYRVYRRTYGSVTATIVEVNDALSKQPAPAWEDTIYVTFRSSIGPNPVDIWEYLIKRYTSFGTDTLSFNSVRARLNNYPMHFCVPGRKNIFTILKELTFMARCAIFLRNGIFHLVYLPQDPPPIHTFDESNVDTNSVEVGFTETENLITAFNGTWQAHGAQDEDNLVILRYNVKKYGTNEFDLQYYAYNYLSGVIKSMTYWIIRRGNTWKTLKFSASLDALNAEVFDGVTCNFTHDFVSNGSILAQVESADYNSEDNTIDFELWTGVRSGEMEQYSFAYPADVSQTLRFPTAVEEASGNAGGGTIGNKAGGTLRRNGPSGGGNRNIQWEDDDPNQNQERRNSDKGGKKPSDTGDNNPGNPKIDPTGQYNPGEEPPPSPSDDGGSISEPAAPFWIDIRQTKIYDSKTELTATFDSFFFEISDNKLKGDAESTWKDENDEGEFDFKWDSDGGLFGAGTAFLQD